MLQVKWSSLKNKDFWSGVALAVVLVLALVLRLQRLEYPIANGEVSRDYLIAHHIVKYHEFPQTGPVMRFLGGVKGSPVYFYVLAAPLLVVDSIQTWLYLNVVLQVLLIFFVYYIASKLLNKYVGLLTAFFLSVSSAAFTAAAVPWQPYLMPVFLLGSFVLLVWVWARSSNVNKNDRAALCMSATSFAVAALVHNGALAFLPLYILAGVWATRKKGVLKTWLLACSLLAALVVLGNAPNIWYAHTHGVALYTPIGKAVSFTIFAWVLHAFSIAKQSWSFMFDAQKLTQYGGLYIVLLISLCALLFSQILAKKWKELKVLGVFLLGVCCFIFCAALSAKVTPTYYFIPLLVAYYMALSIILYVSFTSGRAVLIGLAALCLVCCVYFVTPNSLWRSSQLAATTQSVEQVVEVIRSATPLPKVYIYEINSLLGARPVAEDAILLAPLERKLHTKLASVDDADVRGYHASDSADGAFVVCYKNNAAEYGACLSSFLEAHSTVRGHVQSKMENAYFIIYAID